MRRATTTAGWLLSRGVVAAANLSSSSSTIFILVVAIDCKHWGSILAKKYELNALKRAFEKLPTEVKELILLLAAIRLLPSLADEFIATSEAWARPTRQAIWIAFQHLHLVWCRVAGCDVDYILEAKLRDIFEKHTADARLTGKISHKLSDYLDSVKLATEYAKNHEQALDKLIDADVALRQLALKAVRRDIDQFMQHGDRDAILRSEIWPETMFRSDTGELAEIWLRFEQTAPTQSIVWRSPISWFNELVARVPFDPGKEKQRQLFMRQEFYRLFDVEQSASFSEVAESPANDNPTPKAK